MSTIEIASVMSWATDELASGTPATLDVYAGHQLPSIPPNIPYLTTYPYVPGEGWDDGPFERAVGRVGWVGVMVMSTGRADIDALWALDKARAVMGTLPLQTIPGGVTMTLCSVESLGPPSQPQRVASLVTSTETFRLYVEAT